MNLLIFGASGATGQEVVRQALAQGHVVTAFVRNPAKLTVTHALLRVVQGDVGDLAAIQRALPNQDAVLSALGVSKPLRKDPIVVQGVRNIIRAMEQTGVARFIYLSAFGVRESRSDAGFLIRNVIASVVRHELSDHEEKEQLIRNSSLNWTIVQPPILTNGPRKGVYRTGVAIKPASPIPTFSRADTADSMLRQLRDDAFSGQTIRVLY